MSIIEWESKSENTSTRDMTSRSSLVNIIDKLSRRKLNSLIDEDEVHNSPCIDIVTPYTPPTMENI